MWRAVTTRGAREAARTAGAPPVGGWALLAGSVRNISALSAGARVAAAGPRLAVPRRASLAARHGVPAGCCTRLGLGLGPSKSARLGSAAGAAAAGTGGALRGDKALGWWLLGTGGAVFAMVVLGGVTRLTRSGLSMTDWRLRESWLPANEEEWAREFERYKQFPEYKRINAGMTLGEFKEIYLMEWLHRMWGRGLGVLFGVPLAVFLARGSAQRFPGMTARLLALLALGGGQGAVGWWMVKSGLEEPATAHKEPRVSPYRLAAHLTVALAVYSGLVWQGLTALAPNALEGGQQLAKLRRHALYPLVLAGATFVSGAFVAGNDAGHAYNDWPLFAGRLVPAEIWDAALGWRNFFENTATVQFDHRNLAYLTLLSTAGAFVVARKNWAAAPQQAKIAFQLMVAAVSGQVLLGISTLVMFVPIGLASAHQAGALTVWTALLYVQHTLRFLRP
jgi:cytochrome c oxidase assembly protein subunit 15